MSASIPVLLPLTVTGAVATTSSVVVRVPVAARVRDVTVAVGTAPTGAALTGTVRKTSVSGTVVATFSIAVSTTSVVATVSTVDGADEIADGDLLYLVIAQVGSSVAGSNLTAVIELDGSADQDGVDVHSVAVLRGDHPGSVVS
jgi:hypothetical protein